MQPSSLKCFSKVRELVEKTLHNNYDKLFLTFRNRLVSIIYNISNLIWFGNYTIKENSSSCLSVRAVSFAYNCVKPSRILITFLQNTSIKQRHKNQSVRGSEEFYRPSKHLGQRWRKNLSRMTSSFVLLSCSREPSTAKKISVEH